MCLSFCQMRLNLSGRSFPKKAKKAFGSRYNNMIDQMPVLASTSNATYNVSKNLITKRQKNISFVLFNSGLNRVTLIGRIGKDPEFRGTEQFPCAVFPLATNKNYRKSNGKSNSVHDD